METESNQLLATQQSDVCSDCLSHRDDKTFNASFCQRLLRAIVKTEEQSLLRYGLRLLI
jgi:hypothetical protein